MTISFLRSMCKYQRYFLLCFWTHWLYLQPWKSYLSFQRKVYKSQCFLKLKLAHNFHSLIFGSSTKKAGENRTEFLFAIRIKFLKQTCPFETLRFKVNPRNNSGWPRMYDLRKQYSLVVDFEDALHSTLTNFWYLKGFPAEVFHIKERIVKRNNVTFMAERMFKTDQNIFQELSSKN